jgi:hypothetical protein
LPELLQHLRDTRQIRVSVVEDPDLPPQDGIQMIGVSGFVNDDFARDYLVRPQPGLTNLIYELVLNGKSPLLSEREVAAANSGEGLHLVMLHFSMRNLNLADEHVQHVMVAVNAAFFFFYGGYRLRTAMQEVYGLQAAQYMEAGGFHIVKEFDRLKGRGVAGAVHDNSFLLLLRREDVQPSVVNPLSFLFYPVPPRIHFSPAERRLLELALLNQSDAEIGEDLGISLETVKKTWRRIYERAAKVTPQLFSGGLSASTTRGAEKRRHLLDYLRIHLEELRPSLGE